MSNSIPQLTEDHNLRRKLEIVELSTLKIDRSYQRDLKQRLVEDILRDYDEIAADALTVSKRANGDHYLVNGQHRAAASTLKGVEKALAFVYEGLTLEEEAALRLRSNHRRGDTPLERFHGQLTAKDPDSLAIAQIVDSVSSQVNKINNKLSGMNCVKALETIYKWDEGITLRTTLRLLADAFGRVEGEAAQEPVVHGMAYFLRTHPEVPRGELRRRLNQVGIDDVMRKARSHKSAMGGSLWVNFYRALVETWNYKRSMTHRVDWTIGGSAKKAATNT